MKKLLIVFTTLCVVNAFAARNDQSQQQGQQRQQQASGLKTIKFEELRMACENPAQYHNQTAPANIQIGCQDLSLKWVPETDKSMSVKTSRQVTVLAYSDKYSVDAMTAVLDSAPQAVSCPRFKQVAEKVESMRAVTCAELIAFKGNGAEFCAETINNVKGSNPAAAQVSDTGKVVDLCSGVQQQKY